MPAIYVLDEPETRALATGSRGVKGRRAIDLGNGYFMIEADGELEFERTVQGCN